MRSTVWIKREITGQWCQRLKRTQYLILLKPQQIIVSLLAAKQAVSTIVSVRLGVSKVPSRGFFLISAAFAVCMKAFNLLLYWTLSARPHKSYFWKITETTGLLYINKNIKWNKLFGWQEMDKYLLSDGATVHFLYCRQAPLLWHKQLTVRGT